MKCSNCGLDTENFTPHQFKTPSHYKKVCRDCTKKSKMENRKVKQGEIYIISNPAFNGWYKVGITIGDLKVRLKQYQVGSPFRDYKVEYSLSVNDVYNFEEIVHDELAMLCIHNSEWFKLEINEIIKIIKDKNYEYNN